jgi:hypothetical protein
MLDVGARRRDPVAEYDGVGWSIGTMVGLAIRFCPGKAGFDLASGPGRPVSDQAWVGCTESVYPVRLPLNARLVTGQLQFGHQSEFRLSARPGRVYAALFAENGHRHGKTASMTPESYCEAFGRPYLRPRRQLSGAEFA